MPGGAGDSKNCRRRTLCNQGYTRPLGVGLGQVGKMLGDGRDIVGLVSGQFSWWSMNDRWNLLWSQKLPSDYALVPTTGLRFHCR